MQESFLNVKDRVYICVWHPEDLCSVVYGPLPEEYEFKAIQPKMRFKGKTPLDARRKAIEWLARQ